MKRLPLFIVPVILWSTAAAQLDSLFAVVSGDTVHIWNTGVQDNCARRFVFDVTTGLDSLTVVERDTASMLVHCMCTFDLRVSVTGLNPGAYTAVVYRRYYLPYDTTFLVGSVTFAITYPPPALSHHGYQSDCIPNAVHLEVNSPAGSDWSRAIRTRSIQ